MCFVALWPLWLFPFLEMFLLIKKEIVLFSGYCEVVIIMQRLTVAKKKTNKTIVQSFFILLES